MNKFYVTTAIAYVNTSPHIGFALESVQADVLARYHREKGDSVFFLTGTDEHGTKIQRAALAAGKPPKAFVDEMAGRVRALREPLDLSWDDFIQTSDEKRHWPNAQMIWKRMVEAGDIYKKKYKGLYCVGHEAFVTERDLADGKCRDHQTVPEVVEEENYFFKLSRYAEEVEKLIERDEIKIIPETRKNEILSFISQGVEDISFSRPRKSLSWGIPVPGDDTQVIYVWADALTNYLFPKEWWPADVHVIGKDILRFHALFWPAMLLSAKMELPKVIFSHGFITADGQKMSKTIGNVVDPFEVVERYGTDALRYYLLREIPSYDDGDFSRKKFEERYNGDLANGIGNFSARVLTLGEKEKFDGIKNVSQEIERELVATRKTVDEKMNEFKFHEALAAIWNLIGFGDAYVNKKTPWAIKNAEERTQAVFELIVLLDNIAALLKPFMPATSEEITKSIRWDGTLKVKRGRILFPRLA